MNTSKGCCPGVAGVVRALGFSVDGADRLNVASDNVLRIKRIERTRHVVSCRNQYVVLKGSAGTDVRGCPCGWCLTAGSFRTGGMIARCRVRTRLVSANGTISDGRQHAGRKQEDEFFPVGTVCVKVMMTELEQRKVCRPAAPGFVAGRSCLLL
ncbi:hypothetical protein [Prevotella denticola]|uniref:hypothetical protein n=1 Tax=Prevotella denticola TaxID=28129 RepID=UPI0012E09F9B|nr:hypothetical protein [Prevotella denticola]